MEMLSGEQIAAAALTDWRKLGQGLHARFVIGDFRAGVRFLVAIGEVGAAAGHYPEVRIGPAHVDLKLISDDAIYRDDAGTEHRVEWVTQQDIDLARKISEIAAERSIAADPHPTPRQRFHIDVQVPYDVADQRIAAAVAAGAVIVGDSRAPWTTVIADPDGNKACVGTFQPPTEQS